MSSTLRLAQPLPAKRPRGPRPLLVVACGVLALLATRCDTDTPRRANADAQMESTGTSAGRSEGEQKILLVHSYHTGYPWVDAITQGVKRALAGRGMDLEIYYMDTKRQTSEAWKQAAGQRAREIVTEWQPTVVIAADDNAQQYFARGYAGDTAPQFVFCGVNAAPEKYGYPAANITGVLERPHFSATIDLFRQLAPTAERVAIISDDSPTSEGALAFMKQQTTPLVLVSCEAPSTFADWQRVIQRCQDSVDVIAVFNYHTLKRDGESQSMDPKEVMAWTVANTRIPVVGFQTFTIDDGALCGYLESGVEHGFRAGQIALEVLDGKSPADIPIITALDGQSMVNLATARKLGIDVPQAVIQSTEIVIGLGE